MPRIYCVNSRNDGKSVDCFGQIPRNDDSIFDKICIKLYNSRYKIAKKIVDSQDLQFWRFGSFTLDNMRSILDEKSGL